MNRRKSTFPPNTFKIADKPYRPVFVDSGHHHYPDAAKAFYKVAEMMFPKINNREYSTKASYKLMRHLMPNIRVFYPCGTFATYHTGSDAQREAMNALFNAVQDAIETAHQAGIERGKSLLVMLAKGEITNQQLNEHSVQEDDRDTLRG